MIKKITDLEEMKRVVEVGDKIEVSDIYDLNPLIGTICIDPFSKDKFNLMLEIGYGDARGSSSLENLLDEYSDTWDKIVLIKEVEEKRNDTYEDFNLSIGSKFKINIDSYKYDNYYNGIATLLNFNPSGTSVFLDNNGKLLIVETHEIKYMRCIDK